MAEAAEQFSAWPLSPSELAETLAQAAAKKQSIRLGNAGGAPADIAVSTARMTRVLQYEPRDLTISVEAGMPYHELTTLLAANQQMIPLDPPWASTVTVAGALAANLSGPRRRLYGTGRDLVIGMTFATLEGKLVQSGGMVVKNVAGLDMAKLMIGSHGTLAGIATVNFKLNPIPKESATFVYEFANAREAFALRDQVLKSQLQPAALDLLNPAASALACLSKAWNLLLLAVALPARFAKEFPGGKEAPESVWDAIREFTPRYLAANPEGTVARYSATHMGLKEILKDSLAAPAVARAANGIAYVYGGELLSNGNVVLEHAPKGVTRWPSPGPELAVMQRVKDMMDPQGLLNKGALHGRI